MDDKDVTSQSETLVPGLTEKEYHRIREEALEKAKSVRHDWKLKGGFLCCDSCEFPHRSFIGNDKVMTGIDEQGSPILKDKFPKPVENRN